MSSSQKFIEFCEENGLEPIATENDILRAIETRDLPPAARAVKRREGGEPPPSYWDFLIEQTAIGVAFFAVCDANGPISVQLEGETVREALASFAKLDGRAAIDAAKTEIEDYAGLSGCETMSESAFAEALTAAGVMRVRGLEPIVNAHAGTVADLAGGWSLWKVVTS